MSESMTDSLILQGADSDSDSGSRTPLHNPPLKRRRIIDPSAVTTVPIYSNKVSRSLDLKPLILPNSSASEDGGELDLWSEALPKGNHNTVMVAISDSEEEQEENRLPDPIHSPSPPPPQRCTATTAKRANQKIKEINRKLNAIDSLLSPADEFGPNTDCYSGLSYHDDDDIIVVSDQAPVLPSYEESREIQLKFRCGTHLYKIPVQSMACLRVAVDQLSLRLRVPPEQMLLLRRETELPVNRTVKELGLGIADIIDCVVMEEEVKKGENSDTITVRLQGKDKGSSQDYSLRKDAPLGSVLSQYLSHMSTSSRNKVCFFFDGSKVTPSHTPCELDMEDGDVIEVWA